MSKRFSVVFTTTILILFQTSTTFSSEICVDAMRTFNQQKQALLKEYRDQFNEQITDRKNQARKEKPFAEAVNQNEIVFLIHGFIGTPFEMTGISNKLRESGYTTVLDLMPGHGISGISANDYHTAQILNHVFTNISAFLDCGVRVHLVGFSTGATLIHHYLQSKQMTAERKKNLASVNLISPFYATTVLFSDLLSIAVQQLDPAPSIAGLYLLTKHPDLLAPVLDPEHYMNNLPLNLADDILNLGMTTLKQKLRPIARTGIPVQAFVSDFDLVASPIKTKLKLQEDFKEVVLHEFPIYLKSPHHLMSPSVHYFSYYVEDEILNFIVKSK